MKRRNFMLGAAGGLVVACQPDYQRASVAEAQAAFYHHPGPPSITILSMVGETTNFSEHTGILVSGDQRILYDPAGTYDPAEQAGWYATPRKYDIHYGVNDLALRQYLRYHARVGTWLELQSLEVPLSTANLAIKLCEQQGETNYTFCALSASKVLRQLPEFRQVKVTMLPESIRRDVAKISGVKTHAVHENDQGQNYSSSDALVVDNPDDIAPPPKPTNGRDEW